MTVQEMHIAFKLELDKTNNLQYPAFEPEEIDYWLNRSVSDIVKQRFTGNNPKRESVEETQKRRDDLRNITTNYTYNGPFVNTMNNKPNGVFVPLPADYYYALEEEVLLSHPDCRNQLIQERIIVRSITHDRYNKMVRDPFNQPNEDEIFCLPYENLQNELITGDATSTVIAYYLRYLRQPAVINIFTSQDCDLSPHLHSEIVSYAVWLAVENIESPRVVTQVQQLSRNE